MGQTAIKTSEVIESALGGILLSMKHTHLQLVRDRVILDRRLWIHFLRQWKIIVMTWS